MFDKFTVSNNLRKVLNERDIRPSQLKRAMELKGVKVTPSSLSNYVSDSIDNVRIPSYQILLDIVKALDVSFVEMLGNDFVEHEAKVSPMHNAGLISVRKDLGFGSNVYTHKVESNGLKPFSSGDILLVDANTKAITGGFYMIQLNNLHMLVKGEVMGEDKYRIRVDDETSMEIDNPKVVGRVVANLTKNF